MNETIKKLNIILVWLSDIKKDQLIGSSWKGNEVTASVIDNIISEFIDSMNEQLDNIDKSHIIHGQ